MKVSPEVRIDILQSVSAFEAILGRTDDEIIQKICDKRITELKEIIKETVSEGLDEIMQMLELSSKGHHLT